MERKQGSAKSALAVVKKPFRLISWLLQLNNMRGRMTDDLSQGVYGSPPEDLVGSMRDRVQLSPLIVGAQSLEDYPPASFGSIVILAPPGTVERRFVLASTLRALAPQGALTVLAPKQKGGSRIGKELKAFGCEVSEISRAHHRICACVKPDEIIGLDAALEEGALQMAPNLGLWSRPGVFSWNRSDPGSMLLLNTLGPLSGKGADFGCGVGFLALKILEGEGVARLDLIDVDGRAIEAARRNVLHPHARFHWADVRRLPPEISELDFIVMNPPFHDGGREDRALGQTFIVKAAAALRKGGSCWLTANRHLPYEAPLNENFRKVTLKAEAEGFKVYEAIK